MKTFQAATQALGRIVPVMAYFALDLDVQIEKLACDWTHFWKHGGFLHAH